LPEEVLVEDILDGPREYLLLEAVKRTQLTRHTHTPTRTTNKTTTGNENSSHDPYEDNAYSETRPDNNSVGSELTPK
jgi:hypothetical protein